MHMVRRDGVPVETVLERHVLIVHRPSAAARLALRPTATGWILLPVEAIAQQLTRFQKANASTSIASTLPISLRLERGGQVERLLHAEGLIEGALRLRELGLLLGNLREEPGEPLVLPRERVQLRSRLAQSLPHRAPVLLVFLPLRLHG
jgi:hypothetical protein